MSRQRPFLPRACSLPATIIEIRDPHYDELVDLNKLLPPHSHTHSHTSLQPKNKIFLESISPRKLCHLKKSYGCKKALSSTDLTIKCSDGKIPRLDSPNTKGIKKINKKLKKANSTIENTLIPIDRLLLYSHQRRGRQ
jgi:hypothetical protein